MSLTHIQARALLLVGWSLPPVFRAPPTAAEAQAAQAIAFALSGYAMPIRNGQGSTTEIHNWGAPALVTSSQAQAVLSAAGCFTPASSPDGGACVADQGSDLAAAQAFADVVAPLLAAHPAATTDADVLAGLITSPPFSAAAGAPELVTAASLIAMVLGEAVTLQRAGGPNVVPGPSLPQLPSSPSSPSSPTPSAPASSALPTWAIAALSVAGAATVVGGALAIRHHFQGRR